MSGKKLSRYEMIDFLVKHFRYDTMNSWNRSTSYANCVKLPHLNIDDDDNAYEILDQGEVFNEINEVISDWGRKHKHRWQAGFNGRSDGYIVLYQCGISKDGFVHNGGGLDEDEVDDRFEGWDDTEDIRDRYELVKDFDEMVDECIEVFKSYCENYRVVEEEVRVAKKIKVLRKKEKK